MSIIPSENVIFSRRAGTTEDPFIHYSGQQIMIKENQVLLPEIPDFFQKVTVTGESITWVEIFDTTAELTENQYRVNYSWGLVDFHSSRNGLTLSFDFYGTGVFYLPMARIWSQNLGNTVTQTLQDIIDTSAKSITFHTTSPTSSDGNDGDIWFVYQE